MKRLFGWAGHNIDGVVALLVAVVISTLEVVGNLPAGTVNSAVLLVLGFLAVTLLRDRVRGDEANAAVNGHLRRAGDLTERVLALTDRVGAVERTLQDTTMVRALSGPEVAVALAEGRSNTDRWIFRGGTGTYIRAVTLRDCVANARRDRRALLVRLEIIDPTNEDVCASYSSFRRSLSTDQSTWTVERTQRESYATVVAACWYRQRYELLDIEVGLSQVMPTLRWDLSARHLIVTNESRGPALMVRAGRLLYDYMHTELRKSFEQARRVPLERARQVPLGTQPTLDQVRRLFTMLDMPLPSSFTDDDVADIVDRALHADNPYDS